LLKRDDSAGWGGGAGNEVGLSFIVVASDWCHLGTTLSPVFSLALQRYFDLQSTHVLENLVLFYFLLAIS